MIWYNIGNTAIQVGEFELAKRCYKISIAAGDGGVALSNFGVLSALSGDTVLAESLFGQSEESQQGWEALWNCALLSHQKGDKQKAYDYCTRALKLNSTDKQCRELKRVLTQ